MSAGKHPLDQYPDEIANCDPNPPPDFTGKNETNRWLKSKTNDGIMFVPDYESDMGSDAWIVVETPNTVANLLETI